MRPLTRGKWRKAEEKLSPRAVVGTCGADCANRSRRAMAYRNIPSCESDESLIEEIRVVDPQHPLYGRSFRVIRRSTHKGSNLPPSYEVEYSNGSSLLIPIAATEWHAPLNYPTILSINALQDILSVVDCFYNHEHGSKRSLGDPAADTTAPDRRRRRRSLGGDPS
jgi:hypothetical protein